MAITWTPAVQITNINESRVRFSATRLDSETNESRNYSCSGIVTTVQHKRDMEDNVWNQYQEALAVEAENATKIGNWKSEAKTNLEAKEI